MDSCRRLQRATNWTAEQSRRDADYTLGGNECRSIDMLSMLKNGYNRLANSVRPTAQQARCLKQRMEIRFLSKRSPEVRRGGLTRPGRSSIGVAPCVERPNATASKIMVDCCDCKPILHHMLVRFLSVFAVWICSKTFYLNCQTGWADHPRLVRWPLFAGNGKSQIEIVLGFSRSALLLDSCRFLKPLHLCLYSLNTLFSEYYSEQAIRLDLAELQCPSAFLRRFRVKRLLDVTRLIWTVASSGGYPLEWSAQQILSSRSRALFRLNALAT